MASYTSVYYYLLLVWSVSATFESIVKYYFVCRSKQIYLGSMKTSKTFTKNSMSRGTFLILSSKLMEIIDSVTVFQDFF